MVVSLAPRARRRPSTGTSTQARRSGAILLHVAVGACFANLFAGVSASRLADQDPVRRLSDNFRRLRRSTVDNAAGFAEPPFPESLLQLGAKSEMGTAPMYVVSVNIDDKYNVSEGFTMIMDSDTRALRVDAGQNTAKGLAWGRFNDDLAKHGWMELYLELTVSQRVTNDLKMYSAGFLEGYTGAVRMSQFYSNFYQLIMKDEESSRAMQNIRGMMQQSLEYVKANTNLHGGAISVEPADPYWKHMRYVFVQLRGVLDGYNAMALKKSVRMLDMIDMLIINSNGELPELMQAYAPTAIETRRKFQSLAARTSLIQDNSTAPKKGAPSSTISRPDEMSSLNWTANATDRDWESRVAKHGHCSAFVRLTAENKDLLVGHTTWNDYNKMLRVFKYYNFKLPGSSANANLIAMSSYPGCVTSTDDFYMMDNGLVVMDTSLEILNPTVYDRITDFPGNPRVPNFMHIMSVNRMAKTGTQWTTLFSERNSGTNNAQWMVVDYNRFSPGKPMGDSTVWVVEQVPGMIHKEDVSQLLASNGYWASYNRPYFTDTRRMSGHTAAEGIHGALYSWSGAPRATIFKFLGGATEDLFGIRSLMNRNNWPKEGVLPNDPGHAISARMDLDTISHLPNGGIDAKVVNRCLFRNLQCQAISGPSHANQPVFKWRDGDVEVFPGWPHLGLPNEWNFDWVQMTPSAMLPRVVDIASC